MNKDSSKDFLELDPDDVVYINEKRPASTKRPKTGDSPPPPESRPAAKDKPPIFDLPELELSQPPEAPPTAEQEDTEPSTEDLQSAAKDKPPIFDLPELEPAQPPPSPVAVPAVKSEDPEPSTEDPRPTAGEEPDRFDPSETDLSQPKKTPPAFQPKPTVLPAKDSRPLSRQPLAGPAPGQEPPVDRQSRPKPLARPMGRLPRQMPPPAKSFEATPEPTPPPAAPPFISEMRPAANFAEPTIPPPAVTPEAGSAEPAADEATPPLTLPPPATLPKPPLSTTDLQGNWGSPATLKPPPAIPQEAPPPAAPAEEETADGQEVPAEEPSGQETDRYHRRKDTKRLKMLAMLTLVSIAIMLLSGLLLVRPYLQAAFESRSSEDQRLFENVLVNMLQTDNQRLEIEIKDSQLQKIQPAIQAQEEITGGKIQVNNVLRVNYEAGPSRPTVASRFRFDLDLQTTRRDNFVLDVATVFDGQDAYFMLLGLSINDQPRDLSQEAFASRWSNLEELFQTGSEDASLSENQSVILNYVVNLLRLYSHPNQLFLLPVFHITESRQYNQASQILRESRAYRLHANSCRTLEDTQRRCRLSINYQELYRLYADIYSEVLKLELPAYYTVLTSGDAVSLNLPRTVELTFDTERNYPVKLEAPVNQAEISASGFSIEYKSFDEPGLDLPEAGDPLDLVEYHRQILEYEARELRID